MYRLGPGQLGEPVSLAAPPSTSLALPLMLGAAEPLVLPADEPVVPTPVEPLVVELPLAELPLGPAPVIEAAFPPTRPPQAPGVRDTKTSRHHQPQGMPGGVFHRTGRDARNYRSNRRASTNGGESLGRRRRECSSTTPAALALPTLLRSAARL